MVATMAPAPSRSPYRPSRRTLLATAALVAPAFLLPAIAAVAAEVDPHPVWHAEWRATLAALNRPGRPDITDDDPDWLRLGELEELIGETPARSLAGVRVQLALVHHALSDVHSFSDGDVTALESAMATLERLAAT